MSTPLREETKLGAVVSGDRTHFTVYVTTSSTCELHFFDPEGALTATHAMEPQGDGTFALSVRGVGHGTLYKFVVDGEAFPDPYARWLPRGVHGPAMVVEPRYAFSHAAVVAPPPGQEVIYEIHVGTFTEQGTYAAAAERLGYLKDLGITAVELMPISSFAGERGWGYDGVMHFAPFAPYGTPDELRRFVDEAHGLGLRVFLDVVYNHFGPSGNYLRKFSPGYFTREVHNAWGEALDFRDPAMRRYVLDNALYWLTEFCLDGLRLDAIQTIVDPSPLHILRELGERVSELSPSRVLIGEDDANDPARMFDMRFSGVWADDFHHALHATLTGESDGYYGGYPRGAVGLARIIENGWLYEGQTSPLSGKPRGHAATGLAASAFVYCLQNHDQIGNRALGERLTQSVSVDAFCAASMLLLLLPMTPLLFMGQEWAATSPFLYFTDHEPDLGKLISRGRREEFKSFRAFADPAQRAKIPDPQAVDTFVNSRLVWSEREHGEHARTLELYRQLIRLRTTDPVFQLGSRDGLKAYARGDVLVVERRALASSRVVLVNLTERDAPVGELDLGFGSLDLLLATQDARGREGVVPAWGAMAFAARLPPR